jgi:hypothetical protein
MRVAALLALGVLAACASTPPPIAPQPAAPAASVSSAAALVRSPPAAEDGPKSVETDVQSRMTEPASAQGIAYLTIGHGELNDGPGFDGNPPGLALLETPSSELDAQPRRRCRRRPSDFGPARLRSVFADGAGGCSSPSTKRPRACRRRRRRRRRRCWRFVPVGGSDRCACSSHASV